MHISEPHCACPLLLNKEHCCVVEKKNARGQMGDAFINGAPQRPRTHGFFQSHRDREPNASHLHARGPLAQAHTLVQRWVRMRLHRWRHCSDCRNDRHRGDRSRAASRIASRIGCAGAPLGLSALPAWD